MIQINYRDAITVKELLLITLRFLASGDSYVSLQYLFRVSKQSISKIVPEVCEAIIDVLKEYVKIPSNEEEWLAVSQEFDEKWNFPHVSEQWMVNMSFCKRLLIVATIL